MIEARTNPGEATQKNETPNTITVTMILEDLDNGIDRNGIKDKYGLQAWEVKQMFEHPALKGKKARKVRKLSFNFVDDTVTDPNQTSIPVEGPDVDVHTEASMIVEATPELQNVDGTMDDVRKESQEVDDVLTMYEDTADFGDDEEFQF
jgi:hypothetical protein